MTKLTFSKISGYLFDQSFLKAPRSYIVQSILAFVAIAIILIFVEVLTSAAIVAAVGASTFIVFAMPSSITAQPRRLVGGHVNGIICGVICYYLFFVSPLSRNFNGFSYLVWIVSALSIGLSLFVMAITDTEHPPAASTALGIAVYGWSYKLILFVLLAAICLAIARRLLRRYLKDLIN